jgi:PAS domain S-box-containing protein
MQYNDVLVRKLESKMLEVENANQALQADISARQQAEQALRQSEQDFRLLTDAMPLMAWVVSPDDRGIYVNRRWLQYTGLKLDAPEQTWRTPLHPEDCGRADDHWRTATSKVEPFSMEARLRAVDGSYRWWLVSAVPVTDRNGAISKWIGTCTDIEQLELAEARWRRAEAQLRQTQKMEAVGILAGGIAHDFNNLLLVIIGYSSLILDTIDPMDGFRTDVEEIMRAGERAKDLVQQLLAFSRRQVHAPRVLDLQTALRNMERMLLRLLGEGITVTLAAQPGCYVYADPNLMEQVILNLALNARDAMPSGGQVRFEALRVSIEEGDTNPESVPVPGQYCLLRVTDTGVGMDAATRERIFEPFFTTKEKGKGTGLGLATVFGIVSQSHGQITVHSTPGQGSRFDVYLPLTDRAPESSPGLEPTGRALSGSETILLVEDDHQVRTLIQTLLLRQGYDVLAAANADAALVLSEQHRSRIDLLLTDVVMPNMNGFQLGERLTAQRPELAVLYMSGYTDHPMLRRETLYEGIEFLQKPVAPEVLLRRVRDVLDQAERRRARS